MKPPEPFQEYDFRMEIDDNAKTVTIWFGPDCSCHQVRLSPMDARFQRTHRRPKQ